LETVEFTYGRWIDSALRFAPEAKNFLEKSLAWTFNSTQKTQDTLHANNGFTG
jgi:hypothetical protein